jgi:GH24 family phage-related lysozyme (muramidase)
MSCFARALNIIKKYEGYSETAYPDSSTGGAPYTFGYGSQYYPDGSTVKKGQRCTKQKAIEYLVHDVEIIDADLKRLNLGIDGSMQEALISFIHSVGWDAFLYSNLIDQIECENWPGATTELSRWIFDDYDRAIGGLIDRRREESLLFLEEIKDATLISGDILLKAFRNYTASPRHINAIRLLEEQLNPYVLAGFANAFILDEYHVDYLEGDRLTAVIDNWT